MRAAVGNFQLSGPLRYSFKYCWGAVLFPLVTQSELGGCDLSSHPLYGHSLRSNSAPVMTFVCS